MKVQIQYLGSQFQYDSRRQRLTDLYCHARVAVERLYAVSRQQCRARWSSAASEGGLIAVLPPNVFPLEACLWWALRTHLVKPGDRRVVDLAAPPWCISAVAFRNSGTRMITTRKIRGRYVFDGRFQRVKLRWHLILSWSLIAWSAYFLL